jgi:hypothetical protein
VQSLQHIVKAHPILVCCCSFLLASPHHLNPSTIVPAHHHSMFQFLVPALCSSSQVLLFVIPHNSTAHLCSTAHNCRTSKLSFVDSLFYSQVPSLQSLYSSPSNRQQWFELGSSLWRRIRSRISLPDSIHGSQLQAKPPRYYKFIMCIPLQCLFYWKIDFMCTNPSLNRVSSRNTKMQCKGHDLITIPSPQKNLFTARQRQKISCNDQVAINLWDQLVFATV